MRTIQCDLCKKILGKEVNVGMYSISTAEFSPNNFWRKETFDEKVVDICSECSDKICDAQTKAIKDIRDLLTQKP